MPKQFVTLRLSAETLETARLFGEARGWNRTQVVEYALRQLQAPLPTASTSPTITAKEPPLNTRSEPVLAETYPLPEQDRRPPIQKPEQKPRKYVPPSFAFKGDDEGFAE